MNVRIYLVVSGALSMMSFLSIAMNKKQPEKKQDQEQQITCEKLNLHLPAYKLLRAFINTQEALKIPALRTLILYYYGPEWLPYKILKAQKIKPFSIGTEPMPVWIPLGYAPIESMHFIKTQDGQHKLHVVFKDHTSITWQLETETSKVNNVTEVTFGVGQWKDVKKEISAISADNVYRAIAHNQAKDIVDEHVVKVEVDKNALLKEVTKDS